LVVCCPYNQVMFASFNFGQINRGPEKGHSPPDCTTLIFGNKSTIHLILFD
jgi:hypothetical protein